MSVDRIINESLNDKAKEFTIEEHKYDAMLEFIEKKKGEQRNNHSLRLLNNFRKVINALHIKDFVQITVVILIIVAVPLVIRVNNSPQKDIIPVKESAEVLYNGGSIDAKTIYFKQVIKDGDVVLVKNLAIGGLLEVYNTDKLDKFIENWRNGNKGSVRIFKFTYKTTDKVDSIMDLNYDDSRIEAINYTLSADAKVYIPRAPSYYAGLTKTENDGGVRYSLYEKAEDSYASATEVLAYGKTLENNPDVRENYVETNENIQDTKVNNSDSTQDLAELKLSPAATTKYLKDANYEILPNTEAQTIIILPDSFDAEKDGIKIGEVLKDRNEKSKAETNVDFSSYLGKTVYMYTAAVKKDSSEEKIIMVLAYGEKIIGVWTHSPIKEYESRQPDFNLLNDTLYYKGNLENKSFSESVVSPVNPDAAMKYLEKNNYKIIPNSGASEVITLPENFEAEMNGIKIGEMLKNRNEKSKAEANLDFSQYLGKTVFVFTAGLQEDASQENDIVILSRDENIIGVWTHSRIQAYESSLSDFGVLVHALKP